MSAVFHKNLSYPEMKLAETAEYSSKIHLPSLSELVMLNYIVVCTSVVISGLRLTVQGSVNMFDVMMVEP